MPGKSKANPKGVRAEGLSPGGGTIWVLLAGSALALGALIGYVRSAGVEIPASMRRQTQTPAVKVYTPRYEGSDLRFSSTTVKTPPDTDRIVFAVNKFLEASKVVPQGARARSASLAAGKLVLDFDPQFDQTYGTEDEQTLVKGILTAVGQFDEVASVQLTVGGKPLETLGNIDLTGQLKPLR